MELNLEKIKEINYHQYLNQNGYLIELKNNISYLVSNKINKVLYEEIRSYAIRKSNRYRLVILNNNLFGYIDLKTNKLLPYRFSYASNFLKSGLAIVAINNRVSFINENMEYLNNNYFWEELETKKTLKNGLTKIVFEDGMYYVETKIDNTINSNYLEFCDETQEFISYPVNSLKRIRR